MNDKVLVSGETGFLLSNCIDGIEGEVIPYVYGDTYWHLDKVIHFFGPSDIYDFKNHRRMAYSMVDYSLSIFKIALARDAKFVFASSEGVLTLLDDYSVYKKFFEQYIQSQTNNYLIYRIPRVYGRDRNKGLMKRIRHGDIDDWSYKVKYIDIEDFKPWFLNNLNKTGILEYDGEYRINTISEIKKLYVEENL